MTKQEQIKLLIKYCVENIRDVLNHALTTTEVDALREIFENEFEWQEGFCTFSEYTLHTDLKFKNLKV